MTVPDYVAIGVLIVSLLNFLVVLVRSDLMTARGFFAVRFATLRADRACRATRKACINLHAALVQAAAENRLYNRCLMLANADQDTGKQRKDTRAVA